MTGLRFTVFGIAQPKGSTRAFAYPLKNRATQQPVVDKKGRPIYRAVTTSDNPRSKGWEQLVAEAASRALSGRGVLFLGPIALDVRFYLPRPKSLPRRVLEHVKAPDVDKLIRSTTDALSGVVFADDKQVVRIHVTKEYAGVGDSPRAEIVVEPLDVRERLFFEADHHGEHPQTEAALVSAD